MARVLLNRLIIHLEQGLLPESQCGFRGGLGTVDMIFAARQLQEKCLEQYDDLFIIIIMAGMAVFNVTGYPIEERRRWPVITASPRGQGSQ